MSSRATYVDRTGKRILKVEAAAHEEVCGNKIRWLTEESPKSCNTGLYIKGKYEHDITRMDVIYADTGVYRAYGNSRMFSSEDPIFAGKPIQWKTGKVQLPEAISPIGSVNGIGELNGEWKLVCK